MLGAMANVTYYVVISFIRDEDSGELIGEKPIEMPSGAAATARARSLAATKAGAVAFSRTGNPELGEFGDAVVLFRAGEVPDDAIRGE